MPNIKSAKKRVLTNARKEDEKSKVETRMKNSIKKIDILYLFHTINVFS